MKWETGLLYSPLVSSFIYFALYFTLQRVFFLLFILLTPFLGSLIVPSVLSVLPTVTLQGFLCWPSCHAYVCDNYPLLIVLYYILCTG